MIEITYISGIYLLYYAKTYFYGVATGYSADWYPAFLLSVAAGLIIFLCKKIPAAIAIAAAIIAAVVLIINTIAAGTFPILIHTWLPIGRGILIAFFFCFTTYLTGRYLVERMNLELDPSLKSILAYGLGLGCVCFMIFFIGLAGLLYPGIILLMAAIPYVVIRNKIIIYVKELIAVGRPYLFTNDPGPITGIFHSLFILNIGIAMVHLFTPALDSDDLWNYLPVARKYIELHTITYLHDFLYDGYPFPLAMPNVVGLLGGSVISCKIMHFSFYFATLMAVGTWVRLKLNEAMLYPAIALYSGIYLLVFLANRVGHDNGYVFFAFLNLIVLLLFMETGNIRLFYLSSIMCGLAMTSKYLGIFPLVASGLTLSWYYYQHRFPDKKKLGLWVIIAASLGSIYILKNVLATGNPLYPYYSYIFGGLESTNAWGQNIFKLQYGQLGMERTILDLLISPLRITFHDLSYHYMHNYIGPTFLAFLPIALLSAKARRHNKTIIVWLIVYYAGWLAGLHNLRYLLHAFPLMVFLVCAVMYQRGFIRNVFMVMLIVIGIIFPCATYNMGNALMAARYVTGRETADDYLQKMLGGMFAVQQYINRHIPRHETIFGVDDARRYYLNNELLDHHSSLGVSILNAETAEQAVSILNRNQIKYLYVSDYNDFMNTTSIPIIRDRAHYLDEVYQAGDFYLYKLKTVP